MTSSIRPFALFALLLTLSTLLGCGETLTAYEGPPRPASEVATLAGGPLPQVIAVDGVRVAGEPPWAQPAIAVLPGSHLLEIRYQPCGTYNNCGLAEVVAEVELLAGRTYVARQRAEGCTFFEGLAWFWPGEEEDPCRIYLWIEETAEGRAVWGERPAT